MPDAFRVADRAGRVRARFPGEGEVELFRVQSLVLLQDYGGISPPCARAALLKAGATEGDGGDRLRLPRALIEEALRETPKVARLCGKVAARDLDLPRLDGQFIMRTGTGAQGYAAPQKGYLSEDQRREIAEVVQVGGRFVLEVTSGAMEMI